VCGHDLRVLQSAAGFKIGGDARGAEGMAADPGARAELGGATLDHAPGVARCIFVRQRAGAAGGSGRGEPCRRRGCRPPLYKSRYRLPDCDGVDELKEEIAAAWNDLPAI
jgi:hypothetical protein